MAERYTINDSYIRGTVAFQDHGTTAKMSYIGEPRLPLRTKYNIGDKYWEVVLVRKSLYNPQVVNVDMVAIATEE